MPFASLIGTTKAACPREPSSGSTVAITTCTSEMPPLVAQAFWPLSTHSPAASSKRARVRTAETSEPAFGSEEQKAATLTSSGVPKQRGIHSPICSGLPCPKIEATARAVPMIDIPIPASPQNSSSLTIGSVRPDGVGEELGQPFEAVQPDLGGLLDDRPRRLLLLVPLVGGRAHDVGGEAVDPVADVLLVLGELEREDRPPGPRARRPARPARAPAASGSGDRVDVDIERSLGWLAS